MPEGTTPPRRDGYIAVRKAELAEAIAAAAPPGETHAMADVLKLLGALLHHEAHAELEGLKALYDPLDPDAPMGAMVDEIQMQRVLGYIDQGREQGARLALGGARFLTEKQGIGALGQKGKAGQGVTDGGRR